MAKPAAKDCHTMTSYFVKAYKEKYKGVEPVVNRHSARWGFESVLMGMSLGDAKELVDFYLTTNSARRHPLDWFFYNYEKLIESMADVKKDREAREKMRAESKKRAEEWRNRGNEGITSP